MPVSHLHFSPELEAVLEEERRFDQWYWNVRVPWIIEDMVRQTEEGIFNRPKED